MTLQARITGRIKIPRLDFTNTLLEVGNKDVIPRIAKNIQQGIDLQERKYPPLSASTVKAKGHSRPLIDKGILHRSFKAFRRSTNQVVIRINTSRRKVVKALQIDGIRTKKGKRKFNLFGVSTRMEKAGIRRMEKEIKKRISDAGR